MWSSIHKQIEKKIIISPDDSVFAVSDFADIAESKTVSKTLSRLSDSGNLKRIIRGVFWKPNKNDDMPDPDKVARAIARGNFWRLAPCGNTALHLIGISENKANEWTYVTDGTYRSYTYNGIKISFLHASGKAFALMSEKSALLVQALKAYGKDCISDEILVKIRSYFTQEEAVKIINETKNTTEWISRTIKRMFMIKQKIETEDTLL